MSSISQLDYLPYETLINVLVHLPYYSIIDFCQTNKQYSYICRDVNFWADKAQHILGVSRQQFKETKLLPNERYLQLLTLVGGICYEGAEKYVNVNTCLSLASKSGDIDLIDYFIAKGATQLYSAFFEAIKGGNITIVDYIIDLITENRDIIPDTMIRGLEEAAKIGNRQMFNHLIEMGKKMFGYEFPSINVLNNALIKAVKYNQTSMIDYLISLGANDINNALYPASYGGNRELIEYLINKSYDLGVTINPNIILAGATDSGSVSLVNYALSLGVTNVNEAF